VALSVCKAIGVAQTLGVVWTVYEVAQAGVVSVRRRSFRPLMVEGAGQAGGWAAGVAGMKAGCKIGIVAGLKTGPGALVTGAIGAGIGGLVGYVAAGRLAERAIPGRPVGGRASVPGAV